MRTCRAVGLAEIEAKVHVANNEVQKTGVRRQKELLHCGRCIARPFGIDSQKQRVRRSIGRCNRPHATVSRRVHHGLSFQPPAFLRVFTMPRFLAPTTGMESTCRNSCTCVLSDTILISAPAEAIFSRIALMLQSSHYITFSYSVHVTLEKSHKKQILLCACC